jgi:SAM-dependent methyltransferase
MNPMPGPEEIAGFYPTQYWWNSSKAGALKKLESIYRKVALHDHISFITRAGGNRTGLDLLDVGCGSGTLLGLLKQRGFRPMGVDFSAEAARVAEAENGVRVLVGRWIRPRSRSLIDIVTLFHDGARRKSPQRSRRVSRILKPNGVVVLQVPNIDSWQFKAFGAKWYTSIFRATSSTTEDSMLKLLSDSGFAVRRIKHFNLRDNAPALASSLVPRWIPPGRSPAQAQRSGDHGHRLLRHAYLLFVIGAYPFAIVESAVARRDVMIEARTNRHASASRLKPVSREPQAGIAAEHQRNDGQSCASAGSLMNQMRARSIGVTRHTNSRPGLSQGS